MRYGNFLRSDTGSPNRVIKAIAYAAILITSICIISSTLGQVYPDGMVAYWKFDEATGLIAYDSIGTNHGTIDEGERAAGTIGSAISFDGVNDYVEIQNSSFLSPGESPFAVEAWINTTSDFSIPVMIYSDYGDTGNSFISLQICEQEKAFGFIRDANGNMLSIKGLGPVINDGEWHLLSLVRESKTQASLFVDGIAIGDASNPSMGQINVDDSSKPRIAIISGGDEYQYTGSIDEVAFYNAVLSPEEIE